MRLIQEIALNERGSLPGEQRIVVVIQDAEAVPIERITASIVWKGESERRPEPADVVRVADLADDGGLMGITVHPADRVARHCTGFCTNRAYTPRSAVSHDNRPFRLHR